MNKLCSFPCGQPRQNTQTTNGVTITKRQNCKKELSMCHKLFFSIALLSSCLILTACSQPKTSAERHARQYINTVTDDFDPNFYTNKTDSTRMMVPFFAYFYEAGTEDRVSGISRQQALLQVKAFRSEEFLKSIKSEETFAGKTYTNSNQKSAKQLKAMGDAIAETYMDGYEGRK